VSTGGKPRANRTGMPTVSAGSRSAVMVIASPWRTGSSVPHKSDEVASPRPSPFHKACNEQLPPIRHQVPLTRVVVPQVVRAVATDQGLPYHTKRPVGGDSDGCERTP
jgi:hypothetical protein